MRVLSYSPGDDIGGVGYGMAAAFNRHRPGWSYASVIAKPSYLSYPRHTPWERAEELWAAADVVHLHDGFRHVLSPARPYVVTYHGTGFREFPEACLRDARANRARVLVATLDLWLLAPDEVTWAPAPYDLAWLAGVRAARMLRDDGVLRIGHCPTNRALKSTDAFLAAADKLGRELPVEVVLVEFQPWARSLVAKARCDVYFDQTLYGYGQNSVEAWAMGLPVVCGAADATLEEMRRRFELPFVVADEGSIFAALQFLADPDARERWGARGLEHVRRFHSQAAAVELLAPIYESLVG